MTHKKLIRPDRQRQVPPHFSWVDHRLIRQHRLKDCEHCAWALYLFLVSVGDVEGLSYYSDTSLARALKLDQAGLILASRQLIGADLIAYVKAALSGARPDRSTQSCGLVSQWHSASGRRHSAPDVGRSLLWRAIRMAACMW